VEEVVVVVPATSVVKKATWPENALLEVEVVLERAASIVAMRITCLANVRSLRRVEVTATIVEVMAIFPVTARGQGRRGLEMVGNATIVTKRGTCRGIVRTRLAM
jgi:hypothetical protein